MPSEVVDALGILNAEEPSRGSESDGSTPDPSVLIGHMVRAHDEIARLRGELELERERTAGVDTAASLSNIELEATRRTWSWRLTAPLRSVRRAQLGLFAARSGVGPPPQPALPRARPDVITAEVPETSAHMLTRARALDALWCRAATAAALLDGTLADGPLADGAVVGSAVAERAEPGATDAPGSEALARYAATVAEAVDADGETGRAAWLTALVALGRHPGPAEVERARRVIVSDVESIARFVLEECERVAAERVTVGHGPCDSVLAPVVGQVVVDLSTTLGSTDLAGIQRVVRSVIPRWTASHRFVAIAWDDAAAGFVAVTEDRLRSLTYGDALAAPTDRPDPRDGTQDGAANHFHLVVPWDCRYVVPELAVGSHERMSAMRALVTDGPLTSTAVVGYDLIPVTASETVDGGFVSAFGDYLSVLKHSGKVAAISHSAAEEFRTFGKLLASQGLQGPEVVACPLPQAASPSCAAARVELRSMLDAGEGPIVLVVGSHEPRKNHVAVLAAAEQLWSDGLSFHLAFFGGLSWGSADFEAEVARLRTAGATMSVHRRVSEDALWAGYAEARFTVFPSLVEGYGLPVAESLSAGCPALVSNHGSMAELAADGGAMLVDPRDLGSITRSMRELLTDDALIDGLRADAAARPHSSWDDYAARLWHALAGGPAPEAAQEPVPSRRIAETTDV